MLHSFAGDPALQLLNFLFESLDGLSLFSRFFFTELMSSDHFLLSLHEILLRCQLAVFSLDPTLEISSLQIKDDLLLGILL